MIFIKIFKNTNKEHKILIVFADLFSNKKLNPIVTELFFRGRKLIISFVFITQSYFAVLENIRLNSTHCFENSKQTRISTSCI